MLQMVHWKLRFHQVLVLLTKRLILIKTEVIIMIGFNPKFLMDALRVIDDENVTMYLVNHKSPCFIRDKEENYIYLILPVNFTA